MSGKPDVHAAALEVFRIYKSGWRDAMNATRAALGFAEGAGEFTPEFLAVYMEERVKLAVSEALEHAKESP